MQDLYIPTDERLLPSVDERSRGSHTRTDQSTVETTTKVAGMTRGIVIHTFAAFDSVNFDPDHKIRINVHGQYSRTISSCEMRKATESH